MKHLPNELLYLLKVYNYITYDITLEKARSHSEEIREYIAKSDFLENYPTIKEYLSEEKSIEDIITYIKRNERTYSLLGEWKDREIETILKEKGVEGSIGFIGGFTIYKNENGNGYFTLPCQTCVLHKIVLQGSKIDSDIHIDKVLWLELYKTREGMFLEIFDDNCNTVKIPFTDIECKKVFHSAEPFSKDTKDKYEAVCKMSRLVFEKYKYDSALLNEAENRLLPIIEFFAKIDNSEICRSYSDMERLFSEYGINKGIKLLKTLSETNNDKKNIALSKKISRLLRSKKCSNLMENVCKDLIHSQKS